MEMPGLILAWDCGAGKTGAVLTPLRNLLDTFEARKILVVAPLLVAQTTWPDEIEGWEHTAAISYSVVTGDEKARIAALAAPAEIYIINKENLPWLWAHLGTGAFWDFDTLIVDESTIAKSGRKRSKGKVDEAGKVRRGALSRFGVLAAARKRTRRVVLLTGTPAPGGLRNLWGQAYLVDLGERLGSTITAFENRWFDKSRYSFKVEPKAHAEREITAAMADIMFSLGPEDYGDLPPMVMNQVKVRLEPKILARYRQFARTLVSEPYDVEAVNRGVLTGKLLQFANGSMYQDDGADVWVHDDKLDALVMIADEANGAPMLVAYNFKFDLARIRKVFPKWLVLAEEDARATTRRWNRGEIEGLLAHRASAGHGLNLQQGGNIAVQYGLTHDLELYLQFNKRLHRSGQTKPVFNHHIIAEGTVDEDVLPLFITPKSNMQDRILAAVRVRLLGQS
jgi:hypothetical protein